MLQPMLLALLFSLVLANVFHAPFREQSLYIFSGVVAWDFFSQAIGGGATSLLTVEGFLRQSHIPLIAFHVRQALNNLAITVLGFIGFSIFAAIIDPQVFTVYWLFIPVWLLMVLIFAVPVIVISSIVNLLFRDYQQAIGVMLQALWYVSPAFIPREIFNKPGLAEWTRINPAAAMLDSLRDPLLYHKLPSLDSVANLGIWTLGLSCVAALLLWRYERKIIFLF